MITEPMTPQRVHKLLTVAWIPHWALLTVQVSHGLSWALLAVLGARELLGFSFPGLAWVHLVAINYLTLVSLAVLIHVFHGMLDLEWRFGQVARWSLLPVALGGFGLAAGFWFTQLQLVAASGVLIALGLAGWGIPAALTLASFRPDPEVSTSAWRAFIGVLTALAATAALGVAMAWALGYGGHPWLLSVGPVVHAHLGIVGWLSLLVMGVSGHTVKPITGGKSPQIARHIVATSGVVFGLLTLLAGMLAGLLPLLVTGAALVGLGAVAYFVDIIDVIRRAKNPHRPPQAFMGVATAYFLVAAVLGAGVLAGNESWQSAYVFVALAGWLGQMVVAHLYHIGIRVLATVARGEDDETRPVELLTLPLTWASFVAFQLAIVGVTAGLLAGAGQLVMASALVGLAAWGLMGANILRAWAQANRP